MLQSLREETEGRTPNATTSPRKNGPTSLFKEVRVFKAVAQEVDCLRVSSQSLES